MRNARCPRPPAVAPVRVAPHPLDAPPARPRSVISLAASWPLRPRHSWRDTWQCDVRGSQTPAPGNPNPDHGGGTHRMRWLNPPLTHLVTNWFATSIPRPRFGPPGDFLPPSACHDYACTASSSNRHDLVWVLRLTPLRAGSRPGSIRHSARFASTTTVGVFMRLSHVFPAAALAALCVSTFAPATARAQVSLSLGGGPTFPISNLNDTYSTGYNVMAALGVHIPTSPFGIRLDGMFNQLPDRPDLFGGTSFHRQIWTANANPGRSGRALPDRRCRLL